LKQNNKKAKATKKSKAKEHTIFEDKFQMPEYTTFKKSELLVSYSNFLLKNRFLGKAYSMRCNTEPFFPIRLHSRKCCLCTEDHRAPVPAAAARTCPMSFGGPPRRPGGGTTHTPCCLATYSLVRRCCLPPSPAILPRPRHILCTASQCHRRWHRHCAYRAIG
jgi:hypothetical protein